MSLGGSSGDRDHRVALLAAVSELRPELHRYCARLMGSVIDGEDVVQDTLERALASTRCQECLHANGWRHRARLQRRHLEPLKTALGQNSNETSLRNQGGAWDVLRVTDPVGLAAVTGSFGGVGIAGLTLGGGYGPLIGRFGLALDNLIAADVVLADGRVVTASDKREKELFWALRGGGGNFGVITGMHIRLHELATVTSGTLSDPFSEARLVLRRYADAVRQMPEELTVQVCGVAGHDGRPILLIVPTWSRLPAKAHSWITPFLAFGTVLENGVVRTPYGASISVFDAYVVPGRRTFV